MTIASYRKGYVHGILGIEEPNECPDYRIGRRDGEAHWRTVDVLLGAPTGSVVNVNGIVWTRMQGNWYRFVDGEEPAYEPATKEEERACNEVWEGSKEQRLRLNP